MNDTRKRQRRQTAGALVQNLLGRGGGGGGTSPSNTRKSTAQPRPSIRIPPRGIGPVYDPNPNDVLCGRGGRINAHAGNVQFRDLVHSRKKDYLAKETKKLEKAHIAAGIVKQIRGMEPAGRFLKEDPDGSWFDIGDAKAFKKVGQALREDAPDIRHEMHYSDEDAHKDDTKASPKMTTVVSGRGGSKAASHSSSRQEHPQQQKQQQQQQPPQPQAQPYQPIAYQHLAPPPAYEPIVPQQQQSQQVPPNVGMRGMMPKAGNTAFSGAAAAAVMNDQAYGSSLEVPPPTLDVAFGRAFHPADEPQGEASMISGLSGPTMLSGMSGVSALTDPISSMSMTPEQQQRRGVISSQALRYSQLNQLRQQWAAQHQASMSSLPSETSKAMLMPSAGMGSSLQRMSIPDMSIATGDVSWADHSLIGGGIRDDSMIGGYSGCGGGSMLSSGNQSTAMQQYATMQKLDEAKASFGSSSKSSGGGSRSSANRAVHDCAAMSIQSGGESLPSMPGSIMSDLSENLNALDLAENRLLDRGL